MFAEQSATAPPPRLTEAALIAAMEAHGIGTDATVAEHIQKQLERGCARFRSGCLEYMTLLPRQCWYVPYCPWHRPNATVVKHVQKQLEEHG
jgi:DNA topoisomerase